MKLPRGIYLLVAAGIVKMKEDLHSTPERLLCAAGKLGDALSASHLLESFGGDDDLLDVEIAESLEFLLESFNQEGWAAPNTSDVAAWENGARIGIDEATHDRLAAGEHVSIADMPQAFRDQITAGLADGSLVLS